jgi:glycine reductase
MSNKLRVVHYINQFFAGRGGEEEANIELDIVVGAVGPGIRMSALFADRAEIVTTLIAGDNWANENPDEARQNIRDAIAAADADVVVAGPAFNAGRYGLICGMVCEISQSLGIPAVTSMFEENPGVLAHRASAVIVPSAEDVQGMEDALNALASLATKLGDGRELRSAAEDRYLPRGIRKEGDRGAIAAARAGDMLVARLQGTEWHTELRIEAPDIATPALPLPDLSKASIALLTTGGLVPKGNPQGQVRGGSTTWWKYSIEGLRSLEPDEWESVHRGFYLGTTNEDPNYVLPLDVMREIEDAGLVNDIHNDVLSVSGVGTHVTDSKRIGAEMAQYLKQNNIDGVLLVAT